MTKKNAAAVALGRIKSPAKASAARMVGKKFGGRKPKFKIGDRVLANAKAPARCRGRVGTVISIGPARAHFCIGFDSFVETPGRHVRIEQTLPSWWIDPV